MESKNDLKIKHFQSTSVKCIENITYHSNLQLDIYLPPENIIPQNQKSHPVIYYLKGGGWTIGDKHQSEYPAIPFAESGYIVVVPNYSLSSLSDDQIQLGAMILTLIMLISTLLCKSTAQVMLVLIMLFIIILICIVIWIFIPREINRHPSHILDVAQGFHWTIENIHKYGGINNNIVLVGHSAGASLATLLATNKSYLEYIGADEDYEKIKCVIAISGVYSDKRFIKTTMGQAVLYNSFGKRLHYFDAFPIYNITYNANKIPPIFLINAENDLGLKSHTLDFFYMLRQNGIFVEVLYIKHRNHFNIVRDFRKGESNHDTLIAIISFINKIDKFDN